MSTASLVARVLILLLVLASLLAWGGWVLYGWLNPPPGPMAFLTGTEAIFKQAREEILAAESAKAIPDKMRNHQRDLAALTNELASLHPERLSMEYNQKVALRKAQRELMALLYADPEYLWRGTRSDPAAVFAPVEDAIKAVRAAKATVTTAPAGKQTKPTPAPSPTSAAPTPAATPDLQAPLADAARREAENLLVTAARANGDVEPLTDRNFDLHTGAPGVAYVVEFVAPWSIESGRLSRITDRMSHEYHGRVHFGRVNVDDNKLLAGRFAVSNPPVLVLMRGGVVVKRTNEPPGAEELRGLIDSQLGGTTTPAQWRP